MSYLDKTEMKDPSLFGVAFCAIQVALIGALSGFTLLASISPEPFSSVAEYESDLEGNPQQTLIDAHYFRGARLSPGEWIQKREILLTANNTTVVLTNSEINSWIANKFKKPQPSFSQEEQPNLLVMPGLPNFFIDATQGIHFSMPLEIVVFGKQIDCLLIGEGSFLGEDTIEFHLSGLSINGAAIPFPEELRDHLLDPFESFYENDEFIALKEAWGKVDSVELSDNEIRLNLN
jgi:hypothetical protein